MTDEAKRDAAREKAPDAVQALVDIMRDPSADSSVRVQAAAMLLGEDLTDDRKGLLR